MAWSICFPAGSSVVEILSVHCVWFQGTLMSHEGKDHHEIITIICLSSSHFSAAESEYYLLKKLQPLSCQKFFFFFSFWTWSRERFTGLYKYNFQNIGQRNALAKIGISCQRKKKFLCDKNEYVFERHMKRKSCIVSHQRKITGIGKLSWLYRQYIWRNSKA